MSRTGAMVLVALALAASPPRGAAAEPACRGSISGSVSGKFECVFRVVELDSNQVAFEILGKTSLEGIPGYMPGSFSLERPVKAGTYTLDTLGPGRASVGAENRTLFTATKTTGQRGEVTLKLTSVGKDAQGLEVLHGTFRAKLLPAGSGKSGEVMVEVDF